MNPEPAKPEVTKKHDDKDIQDDEVNQEEAEPAKGDEENEPPEEPDCYWRPNMTAKEFFEI